MPAAHCCARALVKRLLACRYLVGLGLSQMAPAGPCSTTPPSQTPRTSIFFLFAPESTFAPGDSFCFWNTLLPQNENKSHTSPLSSPLHSLPCSVLCLPSAYSLAILYIRRSAHFGHRPLFFSTSSFFFFSLLGSFSLPSLTTHRTTSSISAHLHSPWPTPTTSFAPSRARRTF